MMLNRWSLVLLSSLVLAACSGTRPQDTATATGPGSEAAAQSPAETAEAAVSADACAAQGGTMTPIGRLQRMTCVVAYADAGKTCSDTRDCTGRCLASGDVTAGTRATGTCQRDVSENFGCRQRIEGGVAGATLCVD